VEKYFRARQAIGDNMRIACWISKATNTQSEQVTHALYLTTSILFLLRFFLFLSTSTHLQASWGTSFVPSKHAMDGLVPQLKFIYRYNVNNRFHTILAICNGEVIVV
jgi:hypothetical protein